VASRLALLESWRFCDVAAEPEVAAMTCVATSGSATGWRAAAAAISLANRACLLASVLLPLAFKFPRIAPPLAKLVATHSSERPVHVLVVSLCGTNREPSRRDPPHDSAHGQPD